MHQSIESLGGGGPGLGRETRCFCKILLKIAARCTGITVIYCCCPSRRCMIVTAYFAATIPVGLSAGRTRPLLGPVADPGGAPGARPPPPLKLPEGPWCDLPFPTGTANLVVYTIITSLVCGACLQIGPNFLGHIYIFREALTDSATRIMAP